MAFSYLDDEADGRDEQEAELKMLLDAAMTNNNPYRTSAMDIVKSKPPEPMFRILHRPSMYYEYMVQRRSKFLWFRWWHDIESFTDAECAEKKVKEELVYYIKSKVGHKVYKMYDENGEIR